ncbi:MAG: hypothetical protein RRY76_03565, partial [Clostridia bacterium]
VLPLENIRRQFYQFVEDLGLVWLDFIFRYYDDDRLVCVPQGEKSKFIKLGLGKAKSALFDCKIDVGAVNYWSEISCLNTLDNLLAADKITTVQYLERLPANLIPQKKALIEQLNEIEQNNYKGDAV